MVARTRELSMTMPDFALLLQVIQTLAVVAGLVFAIVTIRQAQTARSYQAAITLLNSYQTPEFSRAMRVALDPQIPNGLSKSELTQRMGQALDDMWLLMTTWESLGVVVQKRQVEIALLDDFFSGVVVLSWHKFGPYVQELRQELSRDTYFEWFQWLSERLLEREKLAPPIPAHRQHQYWPT